MPLTSTLVEVLRSCHGHLHDTPIRRSATSADPHHRRREARPQRPLDARCPLGALRPRPARRPPRPGRSRPRPLPALEGPRPGGVLRGPRREGLPRPRRARRRRRLRLAARPSPRPHARPRRRDLERLARARPADRRRDGARARRAAAAEPGRVPRGRRRARRGQQLGGGAARRAARPRARDGDRGRQPLLDLPLAGRPRRAVRRRGLGRGARRRPRPRRARAGALADRRPAPPRRGGGDAMTTMRQRFYDLAALALDEDPRVAIVLAEIGAASLPRHRRVFNVGIREQLMIGVAAGLALEGMRPVAHSYAPFLVERPYEQIKLDLGHQDVGAVLVSTGASYDGSTSGRTHQAPADVALLAALPGWTIHVPGHPDELERALRRALATHDRVYIRMSEESNRAPVAADGLSVVRQGSARAPIVLAVGPTLDETLAATADLDATVAYLPTLGPFDAGGLRALVAEGGAVVLVEPYLAGTSAAEVAGALGDRPHRLLSLGVANVELRRFGQGREHRAAHGLDAAGIRRSFTGFVDKPAVAAL